MSGSCRDVVVGAMSGWAKKVGGGVYLYVAGD